ncbi:hypothetical protein FOCC_FOCC001849 [Frankliniella occidentalis]|uniref:Gastrula zinc finger protein XlCGF49.1-like isoform X1 n=2 Tax=Frankliniella occidentalis TaxID=133901 RepID=A0A6J1TD75_FRAOC|nr:gastrula zinc finger protein XlCGF49.1-like isoform X1 [Frankliniella occidentalis]KAE8751278.1 hypothetical protein FOCC_FOCC001849 [Frankliniella occidentalis]
MGKKSPIKGLSKVTHSATSQTAKGSTGGSACMICGKIFKYEHKMKVHLRSHTGETPFSCTFCNKAFTQNAALKVHIRTHTKERPYSCKECEKTFARADHLNQHIRTHTGKRPYGCELCQKSFATWSAISRHKAEHLSCNNYICQVCSKTFSRTSNLKNHLLKVHSHSEDSSHPEGKETSAKKLLILPDVRDLLETLQGEEDEKNHFLSGCVKSEPTEDKT